MEVFGARNGHKIKRMSVINSWATRTSSYLSRFDVRFHFSLPLVLTSRPRPNKSKSQETLPIYIHHPILSRPFEKSYTVYY